MRLMKRLVVFSTIVLGLMAIILITVYLIRSGERSSEQLEPPSKNARKVILSEPVLPDNFPFKIATVDGLRVYEYNRTIGQDRVALKVSYEISATDRVVTIPLSDKVDYVEVDRTTAEADEVTVNASELPIQEGDYVSVVFYYVNEESGQKYDSQDIRNFCELNKDEPCLAYLDAGFGGTIINFEDYFQEISDGGNNYTFEFTKVAATQIVKVVTKK